MSNLIVVGVVLEDVILMRLHIRFGVISIKEPFYLVEFTLLSNRMAYLDCFNTHIVNRKRKTKNVRSVMKVLTFIVQQ